jgi:hypothetical protein
MIGYYKNPELGYAITNHTLLKGEEVARALTESKTTFSSPLINEEHAAYGVMFGIYSYICYKAFCSL